MGAYNLNQDRAINGCNYWYYWNLVVDTFSLSQRGMLPARKAAEERNTKSQSPLHVLAFHDSLTR